MSAEMASDLRNRVTTRRSIAHRVARCSSGTIMIDLTMNPPQTTVLKSTEPKPLYEQLKEMELHETIVHNTESFHCVNCNQLVVAFNGLSMRNCLHDVCITCARQSILLSPKWDVNCPANNCEQYFQDREIRGLLTQPEYEHYINKTTLNENHEENNNNTLYKELQELEEASGYITNSSVFECEICYTKIDIGDGMMIRECLHQFCIDCIRNTINTCDEAEIMCPATTCACAIQDREIKSLLTQAEFDRYSMKILRIAESKSPNSFHCKKANCTGWAICEDNVSFFRCPICSSDNCLTCQAIHPGLNCAQYQNQLKYEGMNDDERSAHKMDEIVEKGLGMRCPTCKIVIMKREGCDWLVCSMCKTEICWATKQARWGPDGRGDTSGGCRCSSVKRCHPQCKNCH